MASLNLLQWREQSLWLRYRALHSLGILLLLIVGFLSVQWVLSYESYLSSLKQQLAAQTLALEELGNRQQHWKLYQKQRQRQEAFARHKHSSQKMLNALYALLEKTQHQLQQRELSLSHSQMTLAAVYQQIYQVDEQYLWLEKRFLKPGLKQQLLPQQRVLFSYKGSRGNTNSGAESNG